MLTNWELKQNIYKVCTSAEQWSGRSGRRPRVSWSQSIMWKHREEGDMTLLSAVSWLPPAWTPFHVLEKTPPLLLRLGLEAQVTLNHLPHDGGAIVPECRYCSVQPAQCFCGFLLFFCCLLFFFFLHFPLTSSAFSSVGIEKNSFPLLTTASLHWATVGFQPCCSTSAANSVYLRCVDLYGATAEQSGAICMRFNKAVLWHISSQIRAHRLINICPAAFRWLQGFNKLKEKLSMQ